MVRTSQSAKDAITFVSLLGGELDSSCKVKVGEKLTERLEASTIEVLGSLALDMDMDPEC